jgi:predicted glycosyltransferase
VTRPVVGWYAHHVGAGHVARAGVVASRMAAEVTILSSAGRPADWPAERWVQLPLDDAPGGHDHTAGGVLHWAPLQHSGFRARMQLIAAWVAEHEPAVFVTDVSVEVALLVRLLGVPVATFVKPGDRSDRQHQLAYDNATALIATWPREAAIVGGWQPRWDAKTSWVGSFSRFDERDPVPPPRARRVALVWGAGGTDVGEEQIAAARHATPGWEWTVCRDAGPEELWEALQRASVVVGHAGQNVVSEVAAARRGAVIIAQRRPHEEQHFTVRGLEAAGVGHGLAVWPEAKAWPGLLESAACTDVDRWSRWTDGAGADRCAALIDGLAGENGLHEA